MVRVQGLCVAVLLFSAGCLSFAADVDTNPAKQDAQLLGNGRELKILGGLLLKKLIIGKAVVKAILTKALLVKAKFVFLKMKAVGLAGLLRRAGVDDPEDLPSILDLGKICNVALDVGYSCAKKAAHESKSLQKDLRKMQKVIFEVDGKKKKHRVEHFETEVEHPSNGKTEYYILEEDGTRIPYHPADGDHPVEYVIKNDDGSTSPYHGPVEIKSSDYHSEEHGEVKYEVRDHVPSDAIEYLKEEFKHGDAPQKSTEHDETETIESKQEGKTYEVHHEGEYEIELVLPEEVHEEPVKEIAVDAVYKDGKIKYVRYKTQRKAGVKDTDEIVAFKLRMLEKIVQKSEFKKRDKIFYTRMLA